MANQLPEFRQILLTIEPPLARIVVNRPSVLNALNSATLAELAAAIELCAGDDTVRVLLLSGAGPKAFVAGADIGELATLDEQTGAAYAAAGQRLFRRIEMLGKPVIACIHGFALGGGCELAMACTMRLASEEARFGQPEVKLGLVAGFGGTQRLPRLVGRGAALKLLLTGAIIPAQEALRIGLIDELIPGAELESRALALAFSIAANAPIALERTLDAVHRGLDLPLDRALELEAEAFATCSQSEDMREGTAAFLAKRPPVWRGR